MAQYPNPRWENAHLQFPREAPLLPCTIDRDHPLGPYIKDHVYFLSGGIPYNAGLGRRIGKLEQGASYREGAYYNTALSGRINLDRGDIRIPAGGNTPFTVLWSTRMGSALGGSANFAGICCIDDVGGTAAANQFILSMSSAANNFNPYYGRYGSTTASGRMFPSAAPDDLWQNNLVNGAIRHNGNGIALSNVQWVLNGVEYSNFSASSVNNQTPDVLGSYTSTDGGARSMAGALYYFTVVYKYMTNGEINRFHQYPSDSLVPP